MPKKMIIKKYKPFKFILDYILQLFQHHIVINFILILH